MNHMAIEVGRLVDALQDVWTPDMKGKAIAPVATMLERDFFERYLPDATAATGVFIGSRDRGIVEANAFRLACERRGIKQGTVFIIEADHGTIKKSVDRLGLEKDTIKGILDENPVTKNFEPVLDARDVLYVGRDEFVEVIDQAESLPPIVFIEGEGEDEELIQAINRDVSEEQSLFVMGRNVNVNSFDYTDMTRNWSVTLAQRNQSGRPKSILAYTADSRRFGRRVRRMVEKALQGAGGMEGSNFGILSGYDQHGKRISVGEKLAHPPRLRQALAKFWLPYSDMYAHVLG